MALIKLSHFYNTLETWYEFQKMHSQEHQTYDTEFQTWQEQHPTVEILSITPTHKYMHNALPVQGILVSYREDEDSTNAL